MKNIKSRLLAVFMACMMFITTSAPVYALEYEPETTSLYDSVLEIYDDFTYNQTENFFTILGSALSSSISTMGIKLNDKSQVRDLGAFLYSNMSSVNPTVQNFIKSVAEDIPFINSVMNYKFLITTNTFTGLNQFFNNYITTDDIQLNVGLAQQTSIPDEVLLSMTGNVYNAYLGFDHPIFVDSSLSNTSMPYQIYELPKSTKYALINESSNSIHFYDNKGNILDNSFGSSPFLYYHNDTTAWDDDEWRGSTWDSYNFTGTDISNISFGDILLLRGASFQESNDVFYDKTLSIERGGRFQEAELPVEDVTLTVDEAIKLGVDEIELTDIDSDIVVKPESEIETTEPDNSNNNSGSTDENDESGIGGLLAKIMSTITDFFTGLFEILFGGILELITAITEGLGGLIDGFSGIIGLIGALFGFLPEQMITVLTTGLTLFIVCAILTFFM